MNRSTASLPHAEGRDCRTSDNELGRENLYTCDTGSGYDIEWDIPSEIPADKAVALQEGLITLHLAQSVDRSVCFLDDDIDLPAARLFRCTILPAKLGARAYALVTGGLASDTPPPAEAKLIAAAMAKLGI